MTRLTSVLAVATITVACGGSPQTTGDEAAPATAADRQTQAPAPPPDTTPQQTSAPAQPGAAERPDVLPATASPLALVGLAGLASLGAAFGVRVLRRD